MPREAASIATGGDVAIGDILEHKESTLLQRAFAAQSFWITVAVAAIVGVMCYLQPQAFASADNFFNITRNFSFIGIMAMGMTAVIITGGIDLSVGSVMGVVAIVAGLIMHADLPWWLGLLGGIAAGAVCGAINGFLIAYLNLSSFVVTLGALAIWRSVAVVLSQNKMIYEFGTHSDRFFTFGGGSWLGIATPVWLLVLLGIGFAWVLHFSVWGRHLLAIGGNEQAARLTGIPVNRVKLQAYLFSALCATAAGLLTLAWQGSAINALGTGYELRVIASTVIGGANLLGGEGGAYGAFIGAALIEVIRNSLLMAGVDSNWQGIFVGGFIILAVLLERLRGRRRD